MERIRPWFYDQFQCIAHLCDDTCCAGWEIYIDDASLANYRGDGSEFGLYRQSKIIERADGATFALGENKRCPFLNAQNLCTMILEDGASSLCHICTHHPRFYKEYGHYDEQGIGLCCPEGSRLLLSAPLRFQRHQVDGDTPLDPMAETIFSLRGLLQEILLDRELPFTDRCLEGMELAQQAQSQLYGDGAPQGEVLATKEIFWQVLLKEMMALEPIDQGWQTYLEAMEAQLPRLLAREGDFCNSDAYDPDQYGDIAAYILYRHFPDALWDGEIVARFTFAVRSTLFIHLCYVSAWLEQGALTQEDKAMHLKNWSKQVEYSDENTQQFLQSCKENPVLLGPCR
ncbi:flagellin lysine-N-methylase [Bengtsoniella intestinalis]|uniref:flagellin lysine-N-methylase n=1 Tax=Bengtsoniella intestinalis TaxID=3073143 RepID=UPI00391EFEC3